MSRVAKDKDDHPEAATKHMEDASILLQSGRHDGAAYLAGYVVECSLKAVLLHDKTFDVNTRGNDPEELARWHKTLSRKPYGHNLENLLAASVGSEGARYLPPLTSRSSVVTNWSESMRYWPPGSVTADTAREFVEWASVALQNSVLKMKLDGVL